MCVKFTTFILIFTARDNGGDPVFYSWGIFKKQALN